MMNEILAAMPGDPGWVQPLHRAGTVNDSWLYPIMITLGFIIAIVLTCIKLWKKYKVPVDPFYWFILIGVPTGIIGANFGSCVLGEPAGKPWSEFFKSFGSGLAIEWGVLFVVIAAFIYFPLVLKKPKYRVRDEFGEKPVVRPASMWLYLDALGPCVLLAQFLGRWGNYFNQEVYGMPVTSESLANFLNKVLPGMWIKNPPSGFTAGWYQPLFLWEGIGNFVMFFVLYFGIEAIKQRKAGDLAGAYLLWYGTFRACLEPLRMSTYGTKTSLIFSIIIAIVGGAFIVCNHLLCKKWRDIKIWQTIKAWFKKHFNVKVKIVDENGDAVHKNNNSNPTKKRCTVHRTEEEQLYYCGY